jgi:excisionase family DNA binding protein
MAFIDDTGTRAKSSRQRSCAGRQDKASIAGRLPVRRGLSEVEAAIYLSLSPSFFRRLVDQGVMPRPRIAGGRRIWDVEELDLAFKALPREGGEEALFGAQGQDGSWADFR